MFSAAFLLSSRTISMFIVIGFAVFFAFDSFSFRSIFIGLLFSHFAMGFYYSKNNIKLMADKKYALVLATIILALGLYFSMYMLYMAPYFLIVHTALSDAYLLKMKATVDQDDEQLAIFRTVLYVATGCLCFIKMPLLATNICLGVFIVSLLAVIYTSKNKLSLVLFELPLLCLVLYTQLYQVTFRIQYLGFYHITTWYVFSFWMLFVKERNLSKTFTFFTQVTLLSAAFILFFNYVLGLTITDQSFLKIIAIWSILHIFSTISMSKFNPTFIKKIFYAH